MIKTMTFEESVRKRPYMYIGNDGLVTLFEGLLTDCIKLYKTDDISFEILISGDNSFSLGLISKHDINPFIQRFTDKDVTSSIYLPQVLKIVTDTFEITTKDNAKTEISFSFDKTIIPNTSLDYLKLISKMLLFAILNRHCEIITIDKRQKHLSQNYFHFPQGVFYLFNNAITEALGNPVFKITFDDKVYDNIYQIGLAFRTDWHPVPQVVSFANNVQTICGGSLVEGILDGLAHACKTYVKANNLIIYKVSRKKLLNGLILVCAVRGNEYKYGGSFKETLEDNIVRKQAKKIIATLAIRFLNTQKEIADKFLVRFSTTPLPSRLI
jgi:DNA gyrase/topoisomerase IV subunit B